MIVGIGIDIVELHRIKKILERNPEAFIRRVLSPSEQENLPSGGNRKVEYLAGRYAAKEAVAKALGTGIGKVFSFLDAEVCPTEGGKPILSLNSAVWEKLNLDDDHRLHLSISHSREYAIAQVVLEKPLKQ